MVNRGNQNVTNALCYFVCSGKGDKVGHHLWNIRLPKYHNLVDTSFLYYVCIV